MTKSKVVSNDGGKTVSNVITIERGCVEIRIVGETPLVLNKMSVKAQRELLYPRGRMNQAQRQTNLKHSPIDEFRASAHTTKQGPTLLAFPASGFKGALASAALDLPGTKKAQIGRLTQVEGQYVSIYGAPYLFMAGVRSSDMNKTPDIRTRCIVPQWAATISVFYIKPLIQYQAVVNLLAAAGQYIGIGDGRPEKGKLNFGQFRLVGEDDAEFNLLVKTGARDVQVAAMEAAEPYDDESRELLQWFQAELKERSKFESSRPARGRVNGTQGVALEEATA